jgi:hypothetical protein
VTRHATTVFVRWELGDAADTQADAIRAGEWERLVVRARDAGLVRQYDDGRGRDMWYSARRGAAERSLRAACVRALAGATPVEVTIG